MWNLVLCGLSGILLGVFFSFQRSSPICSKFDYDDKLLERVIRNDILLKDALEKITETKAKVEETLARIAEDHAQAKVKINDAINTLYVKSKDLDDKVESFINSETRNVYVTVQEMKANLKSLVSQTDNELKAKTRQIDEKVEDFIDSASQAVHRNVTDLSSAVRLLVERTASELDFITEKKRKDLDDMVESFVKSVTRNVSVTVEEMKANLTSLVSETDNELKAKTRHIDEKVEGFIDSASQAVHRNVTDLSSAVHLLVQRTASELDIIKAQRVVPLVNFQAVLHEGNPQPSNNNVVFKNVMANDGRGYDPKTGKFTAPVAGVYIFTVQYCPYDYSEAGFEIVQEEESLQRSSHVSWGRSTVCVNMQVVAKVEQGAKVWVRATARNSTILQEKFRWNTFAGLLIHAIEN
ncbi:multimerin-1-like [Dreissena polymorpha]|uniref:C1q domain-containing protein n=1 Tax=Dreissena polymorpha TaxID=45954 RepID=A0A9D4FX01_DREPO|nr:multimerin-1-like [Dreissena polymorpha]KAH3804688.1 hypothetical protein DPMN_132976 [Dreissena polymorpha]